MSDYTDIVFDGPPCHESGRFIEVEDQTGASIKFGEWIDRGDGYWVLRIPTLPHPYDVWEAGYQAAVDDVERRSAPPGPNGPVDFTSNPHAHSIGGPEKSAPHAPVTVVAEVSKRELEGMVTNAYTVASKALKQKRENCLNCGVDLDGYDDIMCSPECAANELG
ncbi:hypothetical protein [Rhodococcoides fascians]|uniref:hypothetical protein n=1 Tax=Rhodococcoides fascians TaxID=1828 RepID=UPI00050C7B74|nr:hypothetical protein [Rhodococcus fascians]